jgi:raffinose/stachyose/melibiose transport system permease protein
VTAVAPPGIEVRRPRKVASQAGRSGRVAFLAVPALLFFVAFGVVPLLGVFYLSFSNWNGIGQITPAGLSNWRSTLTDPALLHSLYVTFLVMVLSWAVQTPLSILIGAFLAGHQRYREWLAVFYFIPLLFSSAALAITFKGLLDPNFGLGAGLGIPLLSQDWLGEGRLAMGVLIFIVSWQFVPFHSLLYQGAIRQIPRSLYEAAQIDGAGRVRQFWSITLPTLRYTIVTSSTLMVVGSLAFFDLIWVLTAGGPGDSTRVLALEMYIQGFRGDKMGPASVIAVILVLFGLGLSLLFRRIGGGSASDSQLEGA